MTVSAHADLADARSLRLPAALSGAAALLLGAASLAGLSRGGPAAFAGPDVINLTVAVPLLCGAAWAARRGSLAASLVWMGALAHVAYSGAAYVLGARSAALLPVHAGAVALSLFALLELLLDVDADAVKAAFGPRAPARQGGALLAAFALALAALWGAGLASHTARAVWSPDAVIALPALLWGGLALRRGGPWGYVLAGALLPKAALVGLSLAAAAAFAVLRGAPVVPLHAAAFAAVGLAALAATARLLGAIERRAAPLPALDA
jgi:hypothetical protein